MGVGHNMSVLIQFRRDAAANWTAANPTLAQGEVGIELGTNNMKIGDGIAAWNVLPYAFNLPVFPTFPTFPASGLVGISETQTITNKTLTTIALTTTALYETKAALPANNINLTTGNYFTKTISGATTLTVSNIPVSNTVATFILDLTNGGSATVTWWSNMKWVGGIAPTLTATGRDTLGFYTHDNGTTWTGLVLGKDIK
jgi:hypothetical protein